MHNETIIKMSKKLLTDLLLTCTEPQQLLFKKMYCHKNMDYSIPDAVEQMDVDKIDHAMTQVEKTIEKNKKDKKIQREVTIEKLLSVDDEPQQLSEYAKEKLNYINGSCISRDFPKCPPTLEWAGAVLDLLEELKLNNLIY